MITLRASSKIGLSPGSMVYVGDKKDEPVTVTIMDYNSDGVNEIIDASSEDIKMCRDTDSVSWINISGIHDTELIEHIGKVFDLHSLLLEDILNTKHRAKLEDFEDYVFIVLKMVYEDPEEESLQFEHICLVVGNGFLISFQEREGDVFDPVRNRIRKGKGRIRKSGVGYLAYALIDMIVDHYFVVLESIDEEIELLQEEALENPSPKTLAAIQDLKHRNLFLRKSIWPVREMISSLLRGDSSIFKDNVMIFLQDVYDHVIHVVDTIETFRDLLSGILDIYMSSVSNKMNEVMKVLTIIATIFIPMTFLAGVYGMNFKYMPELEWRFAYLCFWVFVVFIAALMLVMFKRKKWL